MATNERSDFRRHLPSASFLTIALAIAAAAGGAFIYSGAYNVGADAPHWNFVYNTLDTVRERSIARASGGVEVPGDLYSPTRLASGAGLYTEMCTGCHLGPGMEPSEMSQGLYPQAPRLASSGLDMSPAEQFWVIKHGIKFSAMPAWGKTHNDELIWNMVAFVRKLPKMSPEQYDAAVARAPADHDEMMESMTPTHSDAGAPPHTHAPAPQHGH